MANYILKDEYSDKGAFIKEFVSSCRSLKNKGSAIGIIEVVKVCGEQWIFEIHISKTNISTRSCLFHNMNPIEFPLTAWGGPYSRWDHELREFLQREVCKQE